MSVEYDVHLTGSVSVGFITIDSNGNIGVDPTAIFPNLNLDAQFPPVVLPVTANPTAGNWSDLTSWNAPSLLLIGTVDVLETGALAGSVLGTLSGASAGLINGNGPTNTEFIVPLVDLTFGILSVTFSDSFPVQYAVTISAGAQITQNVDSVEVSSLTISQDGTLIVQPANLFATSTTAFVLKVDGDLSNAGTVDVERDGILSSFDDQESGLVVAGNFYNAGIVNLHATLGDSFGVLSGTGGNFINSGTINVLGDNVFRDTVSVVKLKNEENALIDIDATAVLALDDVSNVGNILIKGSAYTSFFYTQNDFFSGPPISTNALVNNTGGLIEIAAGGTFNLGFDGTIEGGTIECDEGGTFTLTDGALDNVTIEGAGKFKVGGPGLASNVTFMNVKVSSDVIYDCTGSYNATMLEGTITNYGTLEGTFGYSEPTTLTGGGLFHGTILESSGHIEQLVNVDNTIDGEIHGFCTNEAGGTIVAVDGETVFFEPVAGNSASSPELSNKGIIQARTGSMLYWDYTQTTDNTGGIIEAQHGGKIFVQTTAVIEGGTLQLDDEGSLELGDGAVVSGVIRFNGGGAVLQVHNASTPTNTIFGFASSDLIDLISIRFSSSGGATLGARNVLNLTENGSNYNLNLDPNQDFSSQEFSLSADSDGGTQISLQAMANLNITIILVDAVENTAVKRTIATFTDTDAGDLASAFTASITWGDGTTSPGIVSGSNGSFTVSGGHTYADEDSDPLSVAVTRTADNTQVTASGTISVSEGDVFTPQGMSFSAAAGQAFSGTVASFTDNDTLTAAADLSATVVWGDGAVTTGAVSGSNGSFSVSGSHTYTTASQEQVSVTLSDDAPGTASATGTSTATVAGGTLSASVQLGTATEAVVLSNATIAAFSDTNTADMASGFTASITWGDGTTSAGTVSGSNGSFTVSGSHTYPDEATDGLSVTVTRTADKGQATASESVVVGEGDALTPQGLTISATAGQMFSGAVATFTDNDTLTAAADLSATIAWGDGAVTAGAVSGSDGLFSVSGSHTYAAAGSQGITVTLTDDSPGGSSASAETTANVAAGTLAASLALNTATEGSAVAGTVATFTDTNLSDAAIGFAASIAWGDGTTTAGIVSGSDGSFSVSGSHTYADEGNEPLSVALTRTADNGQAMASGTVLVGEGDAFTPQGLTVSAMVGPAFSGTVASFTDSDALTAAGDLSAMIAWGDGTTSAGTVNGSNGSFSVFGSHTYAAAGQDTISTTLSDDLPGTAFATATGAANISAPPSTPPTQEPSNPSPPSVQTPQPTSPSPPPAPSSSPDLGMLDTTTGQMIPVLATPYAGPVVGIQQQYLYTGTDSVNMTVTSPNWFLKGGPGEDALQAFGGYNVLDGGTG